MATHLPEPWIVEPGKKSDELFIVSTASGGRGQRVARIWNVMRAGGIPDDELREANATRLVECVNLFAGARNPTKALELVKEALQLAMASGNGDDRLVRLARGARNALGWD